MNGLALVAHQFKYDQKAFWRNPASVFFTVMFPIVLLLIFGAVFGNDLVNNSDGTKLSVYYVAGLTALAMISASFVNLSMSLTVLRERGVLKRLRGTPLPAWAFITSRILVSIVITLLLATVITLTGAALYGVTIPTATLPGLLLTLIFGAAAFCALGIAFSGLIPSEEAAPALTNGVVLPLYFISGIFFDVEGAPDWLISVAEIFPIRHVATAVLAAFDPNTTGAGIQVGDLAVIGAWGVAGVVLAKRAFRWTPRP